MVNVFKLVIFLSVSIVVIAIVKVDSSVFIHDAIASDETQAINNKKPPAMQVEVDVIEKRNIRLWKEFSGRLTAVDYVEIRPQASGIITEVKFEDGQFVNEGDILYIIDPRPLKAIVVQEEADLMAAQNTEYLAAKELHRAKDLLNKKMISQQVYDGIMNTKLVADSTVKRAEAELSEAKINLSYAYIKSPVSGFVSRAELTQGNLVSAGPNAPLLTTVISSESIYADFDVDEQTYSHYVNGILSNKKTRYESPVELRLQSGDKVFRGKIHAFDNRIDPASGTIRARAIFDNLQGKLLPGMYARLRLGSLTEEKTILVSERAIGTDQNRKFVYVVNGENKTTYREVRLGDSINGNRVVHSGLAPGDKVIVRGLMRIRPNMIVEPKITTTAKTKTTKAKS